MADQEAPIPILLWCPACGERHIDVGEFATKVHHTHACQTCGLCWRPAIVATCGVQFLPGFKNDAAPVYEMARHPAWSPSPPGVCPVCKAGPTEGCDAGLHS